MAKPAVQAGLLMSKATATWLVDNTTLTFEQIAEFCQLHALEVQAIADGDVGAKMVGMNPVMSGQLTDDEIKRCEADGAARLVMVKKDLPSPQLRSKGPRYTPVTKRAEKPDGVLWILRNHPEISDNQIAKLIGSTKTTITAIKNRTHPNMVNLKPRHPVLLGLCRQDELNAAILKAGGKIQVLEEAPAPNPMAVDADQPDIDLAAVWG